MLEAVDRTMSPDDILGKEDDPTMLIMDHDSKFCLAFKTKLKKREVMSKLTAIRASTMDAYMERFIGTYKRQFARRMIFFAKAMLDRATAICLEHYH